MFTPSATPAFCNIYEQHRLSVLDVSTLLNDAGLIYVHLLFSYRDIKKELPFKEDLQKEPLM